MKRLSVILLFVFWTCYAMAGNHYISHIAEENWTTSITVYNDTPDVQHFDLYRWDPAGAETVTTGIEVPANNFVTLTNADFGYLGTGMVQTASDARLNVKLAYRYQDSHSLCEFFIPDGNSSQFWMLPNPYQAHFDWFGIAIANLGLDEVELTLTAWKNGAVVSTETESLDSRRKLVDVSSGFWEGIDYGDVDLVTIESDAPISAPLSITGNDAQDRHVFFLGQQDVTSDPPAAHVYTIPHVAEENWTTALTIYNNTDADASIVVNTWTATGDPDVVDGMFAIPANGTLRLAAGTDFAYRGIGTVSTDDDIQVKLTYRYGESESLCEFFLTENTATQWFIPNSIHDWFDWFGLAVSNPTDEPIAVALDAYKDGELQEIGGKLLAPHTKTVGLANDFWPNISKAKATSYDDVDMVVIRSSAPIPPPLSITGNSEQDRHVFFLSSRDVVDPDFPDPAFKAYILENFDTDENGEISPAEADAVHYIDTPGQWNDRGNIKDITGVGIFQNLLSLEVQGEQLSWIPDLSANADLQELDASYNNLVKANDEWGTLYSLLTLNVNANMIGELPDFSSASLLRLYASRNQLESVPDLSALTDLLRLDLYDNNISTLTGTEHMSQLDYLSIGRNNFSALPDISAMTGSLRTLYCEQNSIPSLPDLTPYTSLANLNIRNNNIGTITGLGGLTDMYIMDLSQNPISTLEDLSALDILIQFDVSSTDITSVPGLADMDSLIMFYCSDTLITDLTPLNGKTDFLRLMCNNCPGIIPPDFTGWTSLQRFGCRACELDDIPDVTDCTALYYYDCVGNNFGPDDCPLIQTIEAMGISGFFYNPQGDGSTLVCP